MFDPFTLGLIGSGIGALTVKNPIKGAILGGGIGAAGGAFLPGLLGASAPAGGVVGGTGITASGMLGGGGATEGAAGLGGSLGTGITAGTGNSLGITSTAAGAGGVAATPIGMMEKAKLAGEYLKPIGQAAMSASAVKGLLAPQQAPIQTPAPMQQIGGSQALTQLAGQNQQAINSQMQLADQQRAQRRQMFRGGLL